MPAINIQFNNHCCVVYILKNLLAKATIFNDNGVKGIFLS